MTAEPSKRSAPPGRRSRPALDAIGRSRSKRALRIAGGVLLGVVAAIALMIGGAWTLLQTRRGGDWARDVAVAKLNARLAGHVEIGRLRIGGGRVELARVVLRDPDGAIVARVADLQLIWSPLPLLRRRLQIDRLSIAGPELRLVEGARGSNLARALAPRTSARARPDRGGDRTPSRAVLDVRALAITGGAIDVRTGGARPRHVHVNALGVRGSGRLDAGASMLSVDLAVDADGGAIEARGAVDMAALRARAPGVVVSARHLDAARLVDGAPPSDLAFDISARGGGRSPTTIDGSLELTAPAGRFDGQTIGPVRLTARAARGRCAVTDLLAALPGLTITGGGSATPSGVDARVAVDADDLGALGKTVGLWRHAPPPDVAGHGRLDLAISGSLAAPSLRVTGDVPVLRVAGNRAQGITLDARLPDLRRPDAADADVRVARVSGNGRTVRALALTVRAISPRVTVTARAADPARFELAITGHHAPAADTATIDSLVLRYPEARWRLARPARLEFGGGRLAVHGFTLAADRQRIEADVAHTSRGVAGRIALAHLDLARLPRAAVPASLGVAGVVDAEARLAGAADHLRVDGKLSLAGGRVGRYRDLSLALAARYAAGRASGRVDARGLGTSLTARFDVPTTWPIRDARAPARLDVSLPGVDLAAASRAFAAASGQALPVKLRGRLTLAAHAAGTTRDPALALDVRAAGLAVNGQLVGDVAASLRGAGAGPVSARVDVSGGAGAARSTATLTTTLSLRDAARRVPTAETLARARLDLRADVERLPLGALALLAGSPASVAGTVTSHATFAGSLRDGQGHLTADVAGAATATVPPTDARVELDVGRGATDARVRVVRQQHPLLAAEAHVDAGTAALGAPARLVDAPVRVRAVIGPLHLQRLGLPPDTDRDPPRAIGGLVHADVSIDGSARAPRLLLHAQVDDVRLDKTLVGYGDIVARYADQHARLDARLTSVNQGDLHATIATTADLGYPAVARGLDVRALPLDARVEAQSFDVRGLSGVTPGLRTVGGLVSAAAAARGTVGDPHVTGRVEWTGGALTMTGVGDYQNIHLAVHGDDGKIVLDDLSAHSGPGSARVTGDAARTAAGYQFTARASTTRMPIYANGQGVANVSVNATATGSARPPAVRAAITVQNARVELSDSKRKDLQPLAVPADVILMDADKPLNRAQAQRLRALADSIAAATAPRAAPSRTTAAAAPPPSAVHLAVTAPEKIWVTGKDAYFEIGLAPGFDVAVGDQPRVLGQVVVLRGRIDIFGRRFDLKADSTLQFSGPPDQPVLDVTAQYQDQTDNVTVALTAKGLLDHLSVTVSSPNRPDLSESQLYALIVTGHLQTDGGSSGMPTPTTEAASLLGGVLAAQLQKTLARRLPLDVLTIDAGSGQGLTGTQLEAGRYVTRGLYVGYVGRVGADPSLYQNRNAVHVEYRLSMRWGLDGEYGDVGTGSLDLTWKKNY